MKKFALLIGTAALVFASCTKEMPGTDPNAPQDVIFTSPLTDGGLKGLKTSPLPVCSNPDADYALVTIEDVNNVSTTYKPAVFTVNNVLYTQALKLTPGTYTVTTFNLMSNSGTPADESDDKIVRATPMSTADFAPFVTHALNMSFSVFAFEKVEVEIDVLCFEEAKYESFGFAWFRPTESTIREMVFFGDFCTKFYQDYSTSDYGKQTGGVKVDMPAIFKIEVYVNGGATPVSTYTNRSADANWGVGEPVIVKYSDKVATVENFEFKLYILVKVGAAFEYKYMNSWKFKDNEQLVTNIGTGPGDDGVYDFVLGNCNAELADFAFAPYMNLPETASMNLTFPATDSYFHMTLSSFGNGFDIIAGTVEKAYCFDLGNVVYTNNNYTNVHIYSSLHPASFPVGSKIIGKEWDQVNWLANHLGDFTGYSWKDLQQALWILSETGTGYSGPGGHYNGEARDGIEANRPIALAMVAAAKLHGDGYSPLPGGWAAVICLVGEEVQTIFTIVDP